MAFMKLSPLECWLKSVQKGFDMNALLVFGVIAVLLLMVALDLKDMQIKDLEAQIKALKKMKYSGR